MTHAKKLLTLVFLRRKGEVLLGMKKRGFGKGKWNGFGGKVEKGETVPEAAARELREECGLLASPDNLNHTAVIDFEFAGDPVHMEVHVFQTEEFSGDMVETEEMMPRWFKEEDVPYGEMWLDDEHWYPLMFEKKTFRAYFLFEGHEKILENKITMVETLGGNQ